MPGPKNPSDLLKNGGTNHSQNEYGGNHYTVYDRDGNRRMSWDTDRNGEYVHGSGHDKSDQSRDSINRWDS